MIAFMFFGCTNAALAQFGGLGQKFKQKAKEALDRQTDKTMDKVVGKGENKVDEKVNEAIDGTGKSEKKKSANAAKENASLNDEKVEAAVFSVNSKFDFIAGDKVVAVEDFSQDAIGDFPAKWNTNASGELVSLGFTGNKKWLQFSKNGIYYPEFIKELPENFTLTFDMAATNDMSNSQSGLRVFFPLATSRNLKFDQHFSYLANSGVDIHPSGDSGSSAAWVVSKEGEKLLENEIEMSWNKNQGNRISIWRQKSRLRVYVNQTKIWDLPRAFLPETTYSLLFATNLFEGNVYLADLKLAYGLPDTRNKLITEGKFSTNGILFDVNSDVIKAESAGVLKEIAAVLKDNPTVKVKIIGHTDTDGSADANLKLSKRRALAVKVSLSENYEVDASRMQSDGVGATKPVDNNQTTQGKANNRRVEFVKM
ncbi:hypothetical protein MASR2M52_03080 [Pedobacter sp.]